MSTQPDRESKRITLLPLPWPKDGLEPHITKRQLDFHYDKHHAGYVQSLNSVMDDTMAGKSLEQLVRTLKPGKALNFAGQIWNHSFYWRSMAPSKNGGGGEPPAHSNIDKAIKSSFGSFSKFQEEFNTAASGHFGSGWAWLVQSDDGKLRVVTTHDGGTVIAEGKGKPLLTCDMWEHAYYLDRQNDRKAYLDNWWSIVNWSFAERCLEAKCIAQDGPCDPTSTSAHSSEAASTSAAL